MMVVARPGFARCQDSLRQWLIETAGCVRVCGISRETGNILIVGPDDEIWRVDPWFVSDLIDAWGLEESPGEIIGMAQEVMVETSRCH